MYVLGRSRGWSHLKASYIDFIVSARGVVEVTVIDVSSTVAQTEFAEAVKPAFVNSLRQRVRVGPPRLTTSALAQTANLSSSSSAPRHPQYDELVGSKSQSAKPRGVPTRFENRIRAFPYTYALVEEAEKLAQQGKALPLLNRKRKIELRVYSREVTSVISVHRLVFWRNDVCRSGQKFTF